MNIFFTCKNTLVIILQFYRLFVVQVEKKKEIAKAKGACGSLARAVGQTAFFGKPSSVPVTVKRLPAAKAQAGFPRKSGKSNVGEKFRLETEKFRLDICNMIVFSCCFTAVSLRQAESGDSISSLHAAQQSAGVTNNRNRLRVTF